MTSTDHPLAVMEVSLVFSVVDWKGGKKESRRSAQGSRQSISSKVALTRNGSSSGSLDGLVTKEGDQGM